MSQSSHEYEPTRPLELSDYEPSAYEPTRPLEPYAYEPYPSAPSVYGQQVVPSQPHPTQPYPTQYAAPRPPYAAVDPRWASYQANLYAAQKSRLAAGLLGIFLGTLGIHNFYLGRTGVAIIQLLLSVLSLGLLTPITALWALIEGIMILAGAASFRTDARGIPLRD